MTLAHFLVLLPETDINWDECQGPKLATPVLVSSHSSTQGLSPFVTSLFSSSAQCHTHLNAFPSGVYPWEPRRCSAKSTSIHTNSQTLNNTQMQTQFTCPLTDPWVQKMQCQHSRWLLTHKKKPQNTNMLYRLGELPNHKAKWDRPVLKGHTRAI